MRGTITANGLWPFTSATGRHTRKGDSSSEKVMIFTAASASLVWRHRRFLIVAMFVVFSRMVVGCDSSRSADTGQSGTSQAKPSAVQLSSAASIAPSNPAVPHAPPRQEHAIVRWVRVQELPEDIAIMESVFWEPDDTISLRRTIFAEPAMRNAHVLEIGTGSGLVSLCCLHAGAARVTATDINPVAVENAKYNAAEMRFSDRFEARVVPRRFPGAWTVIEPGRRFDFIVSNPPWEDQKPNSVEKFALYDPEFALLQSLVAGARERLKPGGRMWLAYGCVTAIRKIQQAAAAAELSCVILDDRRLDDLPDVFLPGMLIELRLSP